MMARDVEPLAVEANRLLQGLAILSRVAREEQREMGIELRGGRAINSVDTPICMHE
jgi:hypothetical protein